MKRSSVVIVCFSLFLFLKLEAQWKQLPVFPTDSGYLLLNKLILQYKPVNVLDYSNARIKMYSEIYNVHDTVYCVYSNHGLYLSPNSSDPIGDLVKNGSANGINCEHTFPQSKGAETGNAKSDMHHLYPARAAVNEARSNYPFAEINDSNTDKWYYKTSELLLKPNKDIDEYSEGISGSFEPREDHKGNVARAIFYFFTMYELQSDKTFFEQMKPTLCSWHLKDPVDSMEWSRTYSIAKYQDQKPNPYVLDCSLARRTFCPGQSQCSKNTNTKSVFLGQLQSSPNPTMQGVRLTEISAEELLGIELIDANGKKSICSFFPQEQGIYIELNPGLESGIYILHLLAKNGAQWFCKIDKI